MALKTLAHHIDVAWLHEAYQTPAAFYRGPKKDAA